MSGRIQTQRPVRSTRAVLIAAAIVALTALACGWAVVAVLRHDQPVAPGAAIIPVLEIPGVIDRPISCGRLNVTVERPYRWVVQGTDDQRTLSVVVTDSLEAARPAQTDAVRDEPHGLRLTAHPAETDTALARTVLDAARLTIPGVAASLEVTWPTGWHEVYARQPVVISAQRSDDESTYVWSDDGSDDASDTTAAEPETGPTVLDKTETITLRWSDADPALPSRSAAGSWFGYAPSVGSPKFTTEAAGSVVAGRVAGVTVMRAAGATGHEATALAHTIRDTGRRCPARVDPPATASYRVISNSWVVDLGTDAQGCLTTVKILAANGLRYGTASDPERCHRGIVAASKPWLGGDPRDTIVVVSNEVANLKVVSSTGERIETFGVKRPTPDEPTGPGVAVVHAPKASGDPVVLVASNAAGGEIDRAAWFLGCRYDDPCSSLADLLASPGWTETSGGKRITTHVGPVQRAQRDARSGSYALGDAGAARTIPMLCALVDIQDPPDPGGPSRDGYAVCRPAADVGPTTFALDVPTLDYVGTISQGIALVGADVERLRVTAKGASRIVSVHRAMPGPGVATFADPGEYGSTPVTYEALDASGLVITVANPFDTGATEGPTGTNTTAPTSAGIAR